MPSVVLIVPGSLETRSGGYGYDRRVVSGLRERGWRVDVCALDGTFPVPTPSALEHAASVFAELRDGTTVLVDGLALGAMPRVVAAAAERLRVVALVHHPLADETGLAPDVAAALEGSEREALAHVAAVVVTSRSTAETLAGRFRVPAGRIEVIVPGTDPAPLARGSAADHVELLTVANLIPRKGYMTLLRALHRVAVAAPHANWRLTCAGGLDHHPPTVAEIRSYLDAAGLRRCVRLAGELDGSHLSQAYAGADAFVLATRYEGYGMAVAEALAHGLPVVSTRTGAIAELVGGDAGIVVEPDDELALADALLRVVSDAPYREQLAAGARRVRSTLPTWDRTVSRMAGVLQAAGRGA